MLTLTPQQARFMEPVVSNIPERLSYHRPTPCQYAIPAPGHSPRLSEQRAGDMSYAERLRRRKTPNGRVTYDLDTIPADRTVHIPASKHVLLAPPDTHRLGPGELHRANVVIRSPSCHLLTSHTSALSPIADTRTDHELHQQSYSPAWDFPGGLDSMLNQALPTYPSQRYYLHYGSSIPTVLPATTQAYLGPTASAGPSLHGPYWPDGSFSPYRPAPLRDSRFYAGLSARSPKYNAWASHERNSLPYQQRVYTPRLYQVPSTLHVENAHSPTTNFTNRQRNAATAVSKTTESYSGSPL